VCAWEHGRIEWQVLDVQTVGKVIGSGLVVTRLDLGYTECPWVFEQQVVVVRVVTGIPASQGGCVDYKLSHGFIDGGHKFMGFVERPHRLSFGLLSTSNAARMKSL
jgi:hypothetical protein